MNGTMYKPVRQKARAISGAKQGVLFDAITVLKQWAIKNK
jgi:hypothetical protein